ncbi:AraC family ethanolamine operon transcriptional activator [Lysobacter niastensis]|uniref:AraC family ethanolamine operon transcriptional activator n=1 Tax=Lysobacter niastensis TaxID=380629 RepID=A0ABU1WAS6_9GAMM|nr:helix-turn-helix domain-containing protein [Lysobacter niastensis]MDR7134552.1 AraC family ethanolamine operon transcriptional activator [Lysobacter niastensis]
MRGVQGRHLLVGRSVLDWTLSVLDLEGVTVMDGSCGGSSAYQGACLADRYALFVPVSRVERLKINGRPIDQETPAWMPPAVDCRIPHEVGLTWLAIVIGRGSVDRWLDDDLVASDFLALGTGRANALDIQRAATLAYGALRVAAGGPDALDSAHARNWLRHQLLEAALSVLQSIPPGQTARQGRPRIARQEVLDRVLQFMEERIDQPIQVADCCARVGVSAATLQNIFVEQFGISPHRYLMLKRLHGIRSALRHATPADTVSSICARFGVWDFGRFASQYKRHFGVAPSQALGVRHSAG